VVKPRLDYLDEEQDCAKTSAISQHHRSEGIRLDSRSQYCVVLSINPGQEKTGFRGRDRVAWSANLTAPSCQSVSVLYSSVL
jgi:hypothetical protein